MPSQKWKICSNMSASSRTVVNVQRCWRVSPCGVKWPCDRSTYVRKRGKLPECWICPCARWVVSYKSSGTSQTLKKFDIEVKLTWVQVVVQVPWVEGTWPQPLVFFVWKMWMVEEQAYLLHFLPVVGEQATRMNLQVPWSSWWTELNFNFLFPLHTDTDRCGVLLLRSSWRRSWLSRPRPWRLTSGSAGSRSKWARNCPTPSADAPIWRKGSSCQWRRPWRTTSTHCLPSR